MNKINYLIGDATKPIGTGIKMIIHVCNNISAWGSGFVVALSKMSTIPEMEYRAWAKNRTLYDSVTTGPFALGEVQFVTVSKELFVANMIGQKGIVGPKNPKPIRLDALSDCLAKVADYIKNYKAFSGEDIAIHAPRFGCGLAGASWSEVEPLILKELIAKDISVTIYDLPTP